MNDEVMKADNHEPDYRKAMLFHSDRADQYAAERDTVVAEAATLRAEVERLRGALEFYADEENYKGQSITDPCGCCSTWYEPKIHIDGEDSGDRARAALEGKA